MMDAEESERNAPTPRGSQTRRRNSHFEHVQRHRAAELASKGEHIAPSSKYRLNVVQRGSQLERAKAFLAAELETKGWDAVVSHIQNEWLKRQQNVQGIAHP